MKARFEVTCDDGSTRVVETENADQAKAAAKREAIRDVDPGGAMNRADLFSHARVKVRSVRELPASITSALLALAATLAQWYLAWDWLSGSPTVHEAGVLQVVSASGTAIGATLAALSAVTGDSLTIPNFPDTKKAWLLQLWADVQVAGTLRVRSPKMHDNVNGIRIDTVVSDPNPLLPWSATQRVYSGDPVSVELAGSAVAGDIEYVSLLLYFEELAGQTGRFIAPDQLLQRLEYLLTVENTIATGTTAAYSGAEAINAEIDQFQHNEDYAILGYKVDTEAQLVGWRAPDFANVRVAGPAIETEPELTADWFIRLSKAYGMPLIPVFNAANKASVLVDALQDENGADTTVTTYLARLRRG